MAIPEVERLRLIGERAAAEVESGMIVGLGTGSTASAMIRALGARVRDGLEITGVATSNATAELARSVGIRMVSPDEVDALDLGIDGADEIDPNLDLVKGRGGALLFEKLVALRTNRFVVISTSEKLVERLGTRLPLPVELVPFSHEHTTRTIADLGLVPVLRLRNDGSPFVTDGGHYIVDCDTPDGIADPAFMAAVLKAINGVVDHGLFIGLTSKAITIDPDGAIAEHLSLAI